MNEHGYLVIELSGLLLIFNGADVHLLKVAHYHHLPLALVFGDASVGRPAEALLMRIQMIFLRPRLNDDLRITACETEYLEELPPSLLVRFIVRFINDVGLQDVHPVVHDLAVVLLLGELREKLDACRHSALSLVWVIIMVVMLHRPFFGDTLPLAKEAVFEYLIYLA